MKYFFLCALAVGLSITGMTQSAISIQTDKAFRATPTGSVTEFTLLASAEESVHVQQEADKYTGVVELSMKPLAAGSWSCVMRVTGDSDPGYIHKLLFSFGVEEVHAAGKTYPISELAGLLK